MYLLLSSELSTINESSIADTISCVVSPFSSSSPRLLKFEKLNVRFDQSAVTFFSFASMSRSFTAEMQMSYEWRNTQMRVNINLLVQILLKVITKNSLNLQSTSISSRYFRIGASSTLRRVKLSLSTSKLWPVRSAMRCQWRFCIALFVMSSRIGTIKLKSSIVFCRSLNAWYSFRPFGSLRHLSKLEITLMRNLVKQ